LLRLAPVHCWSCWPAATERANAVKALGMADAGLVFDNSDPDHPFRWVEIWKGGRCVSRTR